MSTFIITYDLCPPEQNYEQLINAITVYPNYAKINKSCWLVVADDRTEAVDIRNKLGNLIDFNDKLFVAEIKGPAAWTICESPDSRVKNCLPQV